MKENAIRAYNSRFLAKEYSESEKQWHALYTRSRHEKTVRNELDKKGIENFLPVRRVIRTWSDRRKEIEEAIFPSYVFVRIPEEQKWDIANLPGVVSYVQANQGEIAIIPEEQIEAVRSFVECDLKIDPYPYLSVGRRVQVRCGPLRGVEGIIIRKQGKCRLVVSIDFMKQSVSVEIEEGLLEPL